MQECLLHCLLHISTLVFYFHPLNEIDWEITKKNIIYENQICFCNLQTFSVLLSIFFSSTVLWSLYYCCVWCHRGLSDGWESELFTSEMLPLPPVGLVFVSINVANACSSQSYTPWCPFWTDYMVIVVSKCGNVSTLTKYQSWGLCSVLSLFPYYLNNLI